MSRATLALVLLVAVPAIAGRGVSGGAPIKLWRDCQAIILSAALAITLVANASAQAADPQKAKAIALTGHNIGWLMKQCDAVLSYHDEKILPDLAFALGQCFGYIQGVVDHSHVLFDFPDALVVLSPYDTPGRPLGICPDQYNAGIEDMARHLLRQYSPAQASSVAPSESLAAWWIGKTLRDAYPCKPSSPAPAKAGEDRP
jgi:hypothetical protein